LSKKIVHYDDKMLVQEIYGNRVVLYPVDHPDTIRVTNTTSALTSPIVLWDKDTGVIETQNTIYKPLSQKEIN
jgi:hypothetical protein